MVQDTESLLFGDRSERLKKALKTFDKTQKDLEQDIVIVREWIKSQPHLPEVPCDEFLTNIVILNKFSIEKCKKHLDFYYSLRGVLPELFVAKNFRLPHMQVASNMMIYAPLPKLTPEGYRVSLIKIANNNVNEFDPYDTSALIDNFLDIRMLSDIMMGEILVVDISLFTFGHVSKLTPVHIKKIFLSAEKVYKNIVKQIHFVNVAPLVESLISLIKQMVSKKLSERIYAHQSTTGLHQYFPKEILPVEYGGAEYNIKEIKEKWETLLEKYEYRLLELEKLKTDESKRPPELVNDDLLGFYGNFKKLNVD